MACKDFKCQVWGLGEITFKTEHLTRDDVLYGHLCVIVTKNVHPFRHNFGI